MKKLLLFLTILSGTSFSSFSQQDPNFSSDGFTPFLNNPAATGSLNRFSVNAIFRNQWPAIPNQNKIMAFMVEGNTKFRFKSSEQQFNMPIGLNVILEKYGLLRIHTINVPISIPIKLRNSTLAMGISTGIKRIEFDSTLLSFGDPIQLQNSTELDLNTGVFWYGENHYLGFSITNFTAQNIGGFKRVRHFNFNAGYKFKIGKHYLFPMLNGTFVDGSNLIRSVVYFQFKEDIFSIGAGLSPRNSYSLAATVKIKQFKLAYVYDYFTSSLSNASGRSYEFRLSYAIAK